MKVLMNVYKLNIGGTEGYILTLARALKGFGVQVGIATTGGPLVASSKKMGIPVHLIGNSKTVNSRQNGRLGLRVPSTLSAIVSKERYQLVHAHDSESFRNIVSLTRLRKIPTVITIHGNYHQKAALSAAAKQARHIISVSPNLAGILRKYKLPLSKISAIPNGIETTIFRPTNKQKQWRKSFGLPQDAKVLVHVGRFSRDKFPIARMAIMAAERVAKQNRRFLAIFVGPGPYRYELQKLASQANRRLGRNAIQVRPPLLQINPIYYAADVVLGTGRVALEAMACGKPVIAAGVAGYLGIITPATIDYAIKSHFGDHSARLKSNAVKMSQDIQHLIHKPALAASLGTFGAKLVSRKFSINQVAGRLLRIYQQILK